MPGGAWSSSVLTRLLLMSLELDRETGETLMELAQRIVDQVDGIIARAEAGTKPLEIDPFRKELFELFVLANGAGLTSDGADPDLSADGLCRALSERWGLKSAAEQSLSHQSRLGDDQLARMRSLWSVMRMWMEWTYAWDRWHEFHQGPGGRPAPASDV